MCAKVVQKAQEEILKMQADLSALQEEQRVKAAEKELQALRAQLAEAKQSVEQREGELEVLRQQGSDATPMRIDWDRMPGGRAGWGDARSPSPPPPHGGASGWGTKGAALREEVARFSTAQMVSIPNLVQAI